jgi:uncharacterized membrane protein
MIFLVYCTKCGVKNEEDAVVCVKCGASLETVPRARKHERKRVEEECFGIPYGGAIVGLAIGAIILLWGLIMLLQQPGIDVIPAGVSVWPFAIIIFGILIIIGAYFGLRRRYY